MTKNRQKGFTLIELLIVVAIIGIIAAILIPNLIDSLNKGRQKRTMADLRDLGNAFEAFVTDQAGAGAAGATTFDVGDYGAQKTVDDLAAALQPRYISRIPNKDGWDYDNEFYTYDYETEAPAMFQNYLFRSFGQDGEDDGENTIGTYPTTEYEKDIVYADGGFLRSPKGTRGGS